MIQIRGSRLMKLIDQNFEYLKLKDAKSRDTMKSDRYCILTPSEQFFNSDLHSLYLQEMRKQKDIWDDNQKMKSISGGYHQLNNLNSSTQSHRFNQTI